MHSEFMEALENSPVIAAVKDDEGLKKVILKLYNFIQSFPDPIKWLYDKEYILKCHIPAKQQNMKLHLNPLFW